ncbi:sigma-70 family RNA polymerase sigma factor [Paraliomyxa miuraensis]|uniref:sigma-70 family RNA polymerase sigma factor n=1 Tax=Paraliomyxa miuraensis TaxID=376150 RepID=UPI00225AADB0|nr:sigma-70 family RNA polymerase sigma factor [Paraliomyxa miuraensis]MCX4239810.1 sigma-70 family RNA polymerase sigma factor [Paraliomyxa miuraensis]
MTLSVEQRRRVERAKPLVDQLARALARRLARVTEDELRSAGYEALVKCGLRYDPTVGTTFRAFSFRRVRGAMIDTARKAIPGLRQRGRALRVLQATQALLVHDEEHDDAFDPRTLHERVAAASDLVAQTTAAVVLSRMVDDPDDVPDDAVGDLEEHLLDAQVRLQIRTTLLRCCTDQERAMLTALYEEGLNMTELGERMGLSKSTISRKHASLLRRLGKQLGVGPDS